MFRRFAVLVVTGYAKLFFRHRVYGQLHFPKGGGIVASNHVSYLDPPLIGISSPHEIHFLARSSLFRFPPFAWMLRKLLTHPVMKGRENAITFKKTCQFIESGKKVVIFPEGTRSRDGELKKGQAGVAMLVMRTSCFVIPSYVHGTFEIWGVTRKLPKLFGQTACIFGSPLYFQEVKGETKKEAQEHIVNEIMEKIALLKKWYHEGAKGNPP